MTDVAVIDYGMGNLRSVAKAIEHVAPAARGRGDQRCAARWRALRAWCSRARARCRTACASWTRGACAKRCSKRRARSRFSASASACRCCSSGARKATRRGSGCCRGRVRRFPAAKHGGRAGRAAQGAAHGLERGAADRRAPAVAGHPAGQPFLFRAQLLPGARQRASSLPGETAYGVPFTCAAARDKFSRCSSTRKKATRPD